MKINIVQGSVKFIIFIFKCEHSVKTQYVTDHKCNRFRSAKLLGGGPFFHVIIAFLKLLKIKC